MARRAKSRNEGAEYQRHWRVFALVWVLLFIGVCLRHSETATAQDLLPIGQIQGQGTASAFQDRLVRFRGIVTGMLEDENAQGTRFYTVFVQDVPGGEDGDPLTSDGLAIFAGARRPALAVGDIALISGYVTEFYGLTELDNNDLSLWIESRNNPLPAPVTLDPPADNARAAEYLERFEGMLVSVPDGTVVGPAHAGCGFSVVGSDSGISRVLIRSSKDPVGQILGVLHPSDVYCESMPAVANGDEIAGLSGPLTYHFDRFKIVYQDAASLTHRPAGRAEPTGPPVGQDGQLVIATFNVNDYFDGSDDTGSDAEPKPSPAELALKQAKIAASIADRLSCPDVVGLQEVETGALLDDLAALVADRCGFVYQVSHMEGPDVRGADLALLSNPARTSVVSVGQRQACTTLQTGVIDQEFDCPNGQDPLHSRPPLQVEIVADDQSLTLLINHFKSKQDGDEETAAWRLAQANHVSELVQELLSSPTTDHVIVMGDFNDYDGSAIWRSLGGQGVLLDALSSVPAEERYSYIFDGASQLIDWILVSPALSDRVLKAGILHTNADYPVQLGDSADEATLGLRSSDHDVPYIVIRTGPAPMPTLQPPLRPTREVVQTRRPGQPDAMGDPDSAGQDPGSAVGQDGDTSSAGQLEQETSSPGAEEKPPSPITENEEGTGKTGRAALAFSLVVLLLLGIGALILAVVVSARRK